MGTVTKRKERAPATLYEANDLVVQIRPKPYAEPLVWVAYHRRCAEIYGQVARTDLAHQHEAQACAGAEIRKAREIEDDLP